jgi:hypothetical protein
MGERVYSLRGNNLNVAVTIHKAWCPPPPPAPPVPMPYLEGLGVPLRWSWLTRKIAENVLIQGSGAVQLGHDVGHFNPHVSVPNMLMIVNTIFSKCKVMFGKHTVLIGGQQAGFWSPGIAMFQVCMEPVSLPMGYTTTAPWTTVTYGFSVGDLVAGWCRVAIDILSSKLLDRFLGKVKKAAGEWAERLAQRLLPTCSKYFRKAANQLLEKAVGHVPKSWFVDPMTSSGKIGRGRLSWTATPPGSGYEPQLKKLARAIDRAIVPRQPAAPPAPPDPFAKTLAPIPRADE